MTVEEVQKKILQLPEEYVELVNNYIEELLEEVKKRNVLKNGTFEDVDMDIIMTEKDIWDDITNE